MWLIDKWHAYQQHRAQRYLARHPDLGLSLLRRDQALAAQAIEAFYDMQAAEGKSGPHRESIPYPLYSSLGYGARSPLVGSLPKPTPLNLRAFSHEPPARRAINVIANPILELPFAIAVRRPLGAKAHDTMPEPTADQQRRIIAATEMLERPNNDYDGREFLEMLLEDIICLGGGPVEVQENTSDTRPLFLWTVEAQSVRINARWTAGDAGYRYSQSKGYLFGSPVVGDERKFADDEMCYMKLNARTNTPFGLGYLEVAFNAVNSFIGAFNFATRRASNETPAFGLFLGENFTPEQTRAFRWYWENEIEGNGKIPIIGGGRQPTAFTFTQGTGKDPLWLLWQEWLTRVIAMAFGISPMRLGLERDVNRNTAQQGAADDWMTIAPVANLISNTFTHWLLWKRLGWTDLEFQWQVKSSDELRQAQILALQYEMNAITVDEIRQIYERPPLPDGAGNLTRTAYESAVALAFTPDPAPPAEGGPPQRREEKRVAASAFHPFADVEPDMLSPSELAFVREWMARASIDDLEEALAG